MMPPLVKTPEALECVAHECPVGVALKHAWAVAEAAWPMVEKGWEGHTFEQHQALVEAFRPLVAQAKAWREQEARVQKSIAEKIE